MVNGGIGHINERDGRWRDRVLDDCRGVKSAGPSTGFRAARSDRGEHAASRGTASNEKKDPTRAVVSFMTFFDPAGYLRRDLMDQSGARPGKALRPSPTLPRKPAQPAALEEAN